MTSLLLSPALRAELLIYAREALPHEACGLLLGTRAEKRFELHTLRPSKNLHPHSEDRFLIDPLDYGRAEKYCLKHTAENLSVLGFYHSHPHGPAQPSAIDLADARELQRSFPARYLYIIIAPQAADDSAQVRVWRLNEAGLEFEEVNLAAT